MCVGLLLTKDNVSQITAIAMDMNRWLVVIILNNLSRNVLTLSV